MPAQRHRSPLRLGSIVVALVVAGCSTALSSGGPTATSTSQPIVTEPVETVAPTPTPDPCAVAIDRVGTFVVRVGTTMGDMRPLLLSKDFDAVATLGAMRHLSALLADDSDILAVIDACPAMASLALKVEAFLKGAGTDIAAAIDAGFEADGQRTAAVHMFRRLKAVVRISTANASVADSLGLHTVLLELKPGTTAPLGPLPPLPG